MPATLEFRLTGGAANADAAASLGGIMSSQEVSSTAMNNLFDNVTPDEASAGDTEYRMIDVYNSGDEAAEVVQLYVSSPTTSADTEVQLGYDATANSHAANADLESLSDESTAPASPAISCALRPSGSELALPDIAAGEAVRICLRRVVSASAVNTPNDTFTLAVMYA